MFKFTDNYEAARQANVEVRWPTPTAGQNVRVFQEGCTYVTTKDTIDVPSAGGGFSTSTCSRARRTRRAAGRCRTCCLWSAVSSASWVTVLTSMPRYGDDRVSISVAPNSTAPARTATITVRDRTVTIRQS